MTQTSALTQQQLPPSSARMAKRFRSFGNRRKVSATSTRKNEMPSKAPSMVTLSSSSRSSNSSSSSLSELQFQQGEAPNLGVLFQTVLPVDVQVNILGFLNEQDTRRVMQVNHHFYSVIQGGSSAKDQVDNDHGGQYLWKCLAIQRWPYLSSSLPPAAEQSEHVSLSSSDVARESSSDNSGVNNAHLKMNLLLSLAANVPLPNVDGSDLILTSQCTTLNIMNERKVVQFTGPVGQGDRCIRAPILARPPVLRKKKKSNKKLNQGLNLWQRLRGDGRRKGDKEEIVWEPFVLPFMLPSGRFSLVPRCISYFEVSIVDPAAALFSPSSSRPVNSQHQQMDLPWARRRLSRECVAVGLSLDRFTWHCRMPGWDGISFGYHGDDGCVYHNQAYGNAFGPQFGVNDTVGCGIDYRAKRIFFTLNGKFLSYAFDPLDNKQLQENWFPTVGVDTHALVEFNFGTHRPFAFDLAGMVELDRFGKTKSVKLVETVKF